ncbi:MAG: hypothetical protein Q9218_003995 [Villophora microphyllina]
MSTTDSSSGTVPTSESNSSSGLFGHEFSQNSKSVENDDTPRKRRTPGHVAIIACAECRKARQKCDGQNPKPCTRCQTRSLDCRYEPHTKTHKEFLLQEIANLRRDNTRLKSINEEVSEDVLDLRQKNEGLEASQQWQQLILDEIGRNGHDREIIRKLRSGETTESIARWLTQQEPISRNIHKVPPDHRSLLDIVNAFEHHYQGEEEQRHGGEESDSLGSQWTEVSSSQTLIQHLFSLYFTWVHPVHMLFSESGFKDSFHAGDETYCSPALVNAVCSMACHLMDEGDVEEETGDVATLANGFMNQARQEVLPRGTMQLPSVQALAVMYLAELSNGKARSAIGYLRASTEYLKVVDFDGQSFEAREITLCGIQTLNTYEFKPSHP